MPDFQPNTQPQEIAGDIYTGGITVSAVDSSNDPIAGGITLVFGVQSGATDGFDLGIDGVAPLAPPSPPYVQPHFFYSANSVGPPDQQKLQVSIVPDTADVPEWPLVLFYFTGQGSSFTATVTLNWDNTCP